MKIAIDASPLKSDHRFRGVGFYTKNLIAALKRMDRKNEYFLSEKPGEIKEADLVHYPYFHPFFLTLPLLKKKKTVVTIHDLIPLVFPQHYPPGVRGKIRFQIQKRLIRNVERVIVDSEASAKDVKKFLSFPQEKIGVVYLAAASRFERQRLSLKRIREVKAKYQLPERCVLYVGDVNYNKNLLGLAAACKKIKTPLVIVGKQAVVKDFDRSHPENKPLVQLIKEYGGDPLVRRLGFVPDDDLVAIYQIADLYCQPSFYEGFGLPVLEAMACGCPVVAANTASLPEVCGPAAVYVDPYQLDDLAKGLRLVLNKKRLRKSLVDKGFRQAKKFSWRKTAQKTVRVYEKILQS